MLPEAGHDIFFSDSDGSDSEEVLSDQNEAEDHEIGQRDALDYIDSLSPEDKVSAELGITPEPETNNNDKQITQDNLTKHVNKIRMSEIRKAYRVKALLKAKEADLKKEQKKVDQDIFSNCSHPSKKQLKHKSVIKHDQDIIKKMGEKLTESIKGSSRGTRTLKSHVSDIDKNIA